jgi:PiT family inorganic phosphate transporter
MLAIVLSPVLGFAIGALLMIGVAWIGSRSTPRRIDRWFKRLQFVSAALYSLGHGSNDAQKTMGIIWMLLIAASLVGPKDPLPFWVVMACQTAMGLGTLFGGWRIVKTMGMKITKLRPVSGFCASASGAMTLFLATALGVPVSTTHTITGAIVGVGSANKFNAVRWGVAGNIVWAWILTIPCSAFIAAVAWFLGQQYLQ